MVDMGRLKIACKYTSMEWIVWEKASRQYTEDFEITTGMKLPKLWKQGVV
jgi:hypothetical protein